MDRKWEDLNLKEQATIMRKILKHEDFVIHPHSKWMQRWDLVIFLAMIFTGLVTPFDVGFLVTAFNGMFVVNRFVDFLFLTDIILQFFLMFKDEGPTAEDVWVKDRRRIA